MTTESTAHIEATGVIVASWMAHATPANAEQAKNMISAVREALLADLEAPAQAELKPAINPRKSLTDDAVICIECGTKHTSLKRHIRTAHGLSPEEYRTRWGLPVDFPMVTAAYSARRSQLARDNGLGKKVA